MHLRDLSIFKSKYGSNKLSFKFCIVKKCLFFLN